MIIIYLFLIFAKIGLFAFGGGYAVLPLIEKEIVRNTQWLTYNEFLNIVTISQLTPGPIAINAATFVGYKEGGIIGAISATLGVCFPSMILILIVIRFLKRFEASTVVNRLIKGLRPAVIALIAAAAYSIIRGGGISDIKGVIIAIVSFLAIRSKRIDPILVLILAGISGILLYMI